MDDTFEWEQGPAGPVLRCRAFPAAAAHVFTTRHLSFRDAPATADLARLGQALGVPGERIATVAQVHGRRVVTLPPGATPDGSAEADAIVSTDPALAAAIRVADCVPILIADRPGRVVAAVHAGWRGTCAGISTSVVEAMGRTGVRPADLVVAIGPAIGPCCYQVDDRVRAAFLGVTPDAAAWFDEDGPGHWRLDLWRANAEQLTAAGVPADAIHIAGLCTRDHPDVCFSYRRDGPGTGRLVAAVRPAGGATAAASRSSSR